MIRMYIYIPFIFIIFKIYIYSKLNKNIKSKTPSSLLIILLHFMQKKVLLVQWKLFEHIRLCNYDFTFINISFPGGLDLQFAITIITIYLTYAVVKEENIIWFHLQKLWI